MPLYSLASLHGCDAYGKMRMAFTHRIVMISEGRLEPNDTQSGEKSNRVITIQLTRDTLMLLAALIFLGIAILIAIVFPAGSSGNPTPTGMAATQQRATQLAGAPQLDSTTSPQVRATAAAAYPGPAQADAATSPPLDGTGVNDQSSYPAPSTVASQAGINGEFSEQRLTATAASAQQTAQATELPIFAPTRSAASTTGSSAQQTTPLVTTTPIPTFGAPTTTGAATVVPTAPVFDNQATATPAPPPTVVPQQPPTRAPAPPPTLRPPTPLPAPTAVPVDVLRGTVRWTAAQSPKLLVRDQQLVPGATLIIEPGVEVRLLPGVSFFAEGTIYALGKADKPVRIVGATPQRWEGLFGRPGSNITLEYTEIRGGGAGGTVLVSEGGNLTLHHVQVKDNGGHVLVNDSRLEMRDSEIAGNDMPYGSALEVSYASGNGVILTNNRIGGNRMLAGTVPVRISNTTSTDTINLELRGNLLVGAAGPDLVLSHEGRYTGGLDPRAQPGPPPFLGTLTCNALVGGTNGLSVRSETQQVPPFPLLVRDNAIEKHTPPIIPIYLKYGIGRGATSEVALDMRNNWWGNPLGPYEPDRHADGRGESVGDNIDFSPWLTERPACAPQQ